MTLPLSSHIGSRPAYLENLFHNMPPTPSLHSAASSLSCTSTASSCDLRSAFHASTPFDEDHSDSFSTYSKKSYRGRRRFNLGALLHRRTYPQSDPFTYPRPSTSQHPPPPPRSPPPPPNASADIRPSDRRPSLPHLQTSFPPPQAISTYAKRPLPAVPTQAAPQPQPRLRKRPSLQRQQSNGSGAELSCHQCYYYAARNCQGYVMGGGAGDPCETCLRAGFFGAK